VKSVRILQSGLHRGEESIVFGNDRSGMVVFSGCHLSCSFCYTPETSRDFIGKDFSLEAFSSLLESLVEQGARNISLISPSHVWNFIEPALQQFKHTHGGYYPLILKVSGFESPAQIRRFARVADVFVPDFKVWDESVATAVALPKHYGRVAQAALKAIDESHRAPTWEGTVLRRGTVVRHLLMPDYAPDSCDVVKAAWQIGYHGLMNFMTCFIEPGKGLKRAPAHQVDALVGQARSLGIVPMVDGQLRQAG
jgi:putative pyruvate formate lyase activating enzyme